MKSLDMKKELGIIQSKGGYRVQINNFKILFILMIVYTVMSLLFPEMFLNKLLFVLILVFFIITKKTIRAWFIAPISILLVFIYGFLLSFFNYSSIKLAIQFLLAIFILFLIYPIVSYEIDMDMVASIGGVFLLVADLLFVFFIASKYSFRLPFGISEYGIVARIVPNSFFEMLERYGETAFGYRGYFGNFNTMIHIGTIPFLYLPTCLWFKNWMQTKKIRYIVLVILSLFAIFLSTSRGLLLLTVGMLFFLYVIHRHSNSTKLIALFITLLVVIYLLSYILHTTEVFSIKDSSNNLKVDHLVSAFREMTPLQFLFGKGLGSYFYSYGVGAELAHTEITLLDYFRYFGVPLAIYIYYKLINPFSIQQLVNLKLKKNTFEERIVFLGYLLMSLTNPVLMNSLGTLVILWYWSKLVRAENNMHNSIILEGTCNG